MNAKNTKTVGNLISASFGQLHAFWNASTGFPAYNPGRDDSESWGTPTTAIPMGMASGFDLSKGALVAIDVATAKRVFAELAENETDEATKELYLAIANDPVAVAMAQREARIKELLASGEETTKYVVSNPAKPDEDLTIEVTNRQVADAIALFAKVEPTHFVVCGQRRSYAAGHTLALAEKQHEVKPTDYEWFAKIIEPGSLAELHDTILQENQSHDKQGYSLVGLTRNAIKLLDERPRLGETDLGRLLGAVDQRSATDGKVTKSYRGLRQTLSRLARLALAFPELHLAERIGMDAEFYKSGAKEGRVKYVKGGYIPVAKLNKEDVASLLGERKEATPVVAALMPNYEKGVQATLAVVEKYVKTVIDGEKPRGGVTSAEIKGWQSVARITNATPKLGDVFKALLAGDVEWFDNLGK